MVAVAVSGLLSTGLIGRNAYEEWRSEQKELRGNQLYFYYAAGQRLSEP